MGKIMKSGKIVVVLRGRYAGKKAVIVKAYDDGTADKQFSHAIVAGIQRYPRRMKRKMTQKNMMRRSKIKPFIKLVNFTHLLPTRYTLSDVAPAIQPKDLKDPMKKKNLRFQVKKKFEERFRSGKKSWLFQKLKF
ncbi:unnamed protein product [Bemisia tabaci]|uniref:Large ribosomal subunit protein eL27 n=1 Tax=Bemisia tabaci TaxID=7038 RepID=A0A9P0F335_BEMTA|nr:PREDICTED: 60S ribosomal protein L27 [Bemisia tabaci]CAH0387624.1 unnamed protein product [Bemisia tabaci]